LPVWRLELPCLKAIDRVAALQPDLPGDPAILQQTRDYLIEAQRLLGPDPLREFYEQMAPPLPSTKTG
jgi:hypothetical protein